MILGLLLVDDAQTEVDLVRLLKVGLDAHHLRKRFFGEIQTSIAVILGSSSAQSFPAGDFRGQTDQNRNPIPQLGVVSSWYGSRKDVTYLGILIDVSNWRASGGGFIPWDHVDGRRLADRRHMPAGGRPSSDSSGLIQGLEIIFSSFEYINYQDCPRRRHWCHRS